MNSDGRKIVWEFIKLGFVLILIGAVLGALIEIDWRIEVKIILGGFFLALCLIANEVSRVFNLNNILSEIHAKTLMQLMLMGKKQGVKEDINDLWDDIREEEKKKLDFQRKLIGDIDIKFSIGIIIAIAVISIITVIIIQELF